VFANIQNLHELDDISYLSEQQKEIIKKFFINFKDNHNSELKQRFLNLWSKLEDIEIEANHDKIDTKSEELNNVL